MEVTSQLKASPELAKPYQLVEATTGAAQLAFIAPESAAVTANAQGGISVAYPNARFWISLHAEPAGTPLEPDGFRQRVAAGKSKAAILQEMDRGVGDQMGRLFEVEFEAAGAVTLLQRTVLFVAEQKLFEISCTANPGAEAEAWKALDRLLSTFQVGAPGKLELPVISGKL